MHLAETPEEQQAWMKQWRAAAVALRKVKREELRAMTDEDAVAAFNALDLPPHDFPRSAELACDCKGYFKELIQKVLVGAILKLGRGYSNAASPLRGQGGTGRIAKPGSDSSTRAQLVQPAPI